MRMVYLAEVYRRFLKMMSVAGCSEDRVSDPPTSLAPNNFVGIWSEAKPGDPENKNRHHI